MVRAAFERAKEFLQEHRAGLLYSATFAIIFLTIHHYKGTP